jgi:hypothetical protein
MLFLLRQALTKNEWLALKISGAVYSHRTGCSRSELDAQGPEVDAMIDKRPGFK